MFNIGVGEIVLVLLIAFIVVGPKDLPKIARGIAKAIKYIKVNIKEIFATLNLEDELSDIQEANEVIKQTIAEANPASVIEKEVKEVKQTINETVAQSNPAEITKEINAAKNAAKKTVQSIHISTKD